LSVISFPPDLEEIDELASERKEEAKVENADQDKEGKVKKQEIIKVIENLEIHDKAEEKDEENVKSIEKNKGEDANNVNEELDDNKASDLMKVEDSLTREFKIGEKKPVEEEQIDKVKEVETKLLEPDVIQYKYTVEENHIDKINQVDNVTHNNLQNEEDVLIHKFENKKIETNSRVKQHVKKDNRKKSNDLKVEKKQSEPFREHAIDNDVIAQTEEPILLESIEKSVIQAEVNPLAESVPVNVETIDIRQEVPELIKIEDKQPKPFENEEDNKKPNKVIIPQSLREYVMRDLIIEDVENLQDNDKSLTSSYVKIETPNVNVRQVNAPVEESKKDVILAEILTQPVQNIVTEVIETKIQETPGIVLDTVISPEPERIEIKQIVEEITIPVKNEIIQPVVETKTIINMEDGEQRLNSEQDEIQESIMLQNLNREKVITVKDAEDYPDDILVRPPEDSFLKYINPVNIGYAAVTVTGLVLSFLLYKKYGK
jgi:hypothetical protein